jgi:glutaminase
LFDSFDRDSGDRVSHWEVLSRLQRSGVLPDDPRIQEALAGLPGTDGSSEQVDFEQFKAIARHNSSLIQRAVEGNLAVPDFPALTADIDRMYNSWRLPRGTPVPSRTWWPSSRARRWPSEP